MLIKDVYENYARYLSRTIAYDLLKQITRYHRIQGSRGIWSSIDTLKGELERLGYDVKILKIDSGSKKGFIETPVSWDPLEGFIEFKIGDRVLAKYDLIDHPTLISAHSPGNEGCGELSVCRGDTCEGEAVLATGYPLIDLYYDIEAKAIIYYSENRFHDAVPYTGLFLRPGDKIMDKTVINIPYRLASRLIDYIVTRKKRISVCWKTKVEYHSVGLPVLIACKGDDPGPLFISHICHPKPGAHDNASGSIANYVTAYILSRVGKEYDYSSCHVWVPEYTGTVFIYDKLPWKPLGVYNLDMVGSRQSITGSTLTLVNPPRYMDTYTASTLWISIQKVFDQSKSFNNITQPSIRYGLTPYTIGSDHDIFISWGIDSSMLNEWPSKYYHTDMDEIDTLNPHNIGLTGLASALAGYLLTRTNKDKLLSLKKLYESIVRNWYSIQAYKNNFSLNFLNKYLIKKPIITKTPEKPYLETPLSARKIREIIGKEKFKEIREISGVATYLELYAPLAEAIGLKDTIKHYRAELMLSWSRKTENIIREAWEIIKSTLKI